MNYKNTFRMLLPLLFLALGSAQISYAKGANNEAINAAVKALQDGNTATASRQGKVAIRHCGSDKKCIFQTHLSLARGYADIAKWSAAVYRGKQAVAAAKRLDDSESLTVAYAYYAIAVAGSGDKKKTEEIIELGLEEAYKVNREQNGERVPIELLMAGAQSILQYNNENFAEAAVFQERFVRGHKKVWPGSVEVVKEMLLLSNIYVYTKDISANHNILQGAKQILASKGDSAYIQSLRLAVDAARSNLVALRGKMYIDGCLPVMQAYDQVLLASARQMLMMDAQRVFQQRIELEEEVKARYSAMMDPASTVDAREAAANDAFAQCVNLREELEQLGVEFVVNQPQEDAQN